MVKGLQQKNYSCTTNQKYYYNKKPVQQHLLQINIEICLFWRPPVTEYMYPIR